MASSRQSHPSSNGGVITLTFFILFMALPYLIGFYGSSRNLSVVQDFLDPWLLPYHHVWDLLGEANDNRYKPLFSQIGQHGRSVGVVAAPTSLSRRAGNDVLARLSRRLVEATLLGCHDDLD
jgi:hypothetical protein